MARSVIAIEMLISNLMDLLNNDLYLGALTSANISDTICFDCNLWLNGYSNSDGEVVISPIRTTVINNLTDIQNQLNTVLKDRNINDYGFKAQIQRLLEIVIDLSSKIKSLQCSPYTCDSNLMAEFLSTLITTIVQLITLLDYLNGLLSYYEYCDCMGNNLFSLLMGKFINSVTELQSYLREWYYIVIAFFQYVSMSQKNYVASYMPRSTIQVPPFNVATSHACVPCPTQNPPIIQRQQVSNNCNTCNNCNPCTSFPC